MYILYLYIYIWEHMGTFYRENGPVESFMKWALTSRFEQQSRASGAVYLLRYGGSCGAVPAGPWGSRGVRGASQGRPRGSQGRARASQGRPQGSHGRARASQGRPQGSQGRAQGIPQLPRGSGDVPGIPRILFIKIPEYISIISFCNMLP